jgi:hypothetical protein
MAHTTTSVARPRRSWLREALIVVGVLAFGGFTLMTDAHMPIGEVLSGLTSVLR